MKEGFAVVAYPMLSADDRRRIEESRAQYDPQAGRIGAHITLVFPTDVAEAALVSPVRDSLRDQGPIRITLPRAATAPDSVEGGHVAFPVVEQGSRGLLAVHRRLYRGVLAGRARPDIPYAPHITVGAHQMPAECEKIATLLNDQGRQVIIGWITSVDVVRVDESSVRTVAEIPLRARATPSR
jgi:2'-5' RNA ligase